MNIRRLLQLESQVAENTARITKLEKAKNRSHSKKPPGKSAKK